MIKKEVDRIQAWFETCSGVKPSFVCFASANPKTDKKTDCSQCLEIVKKLKNQVEG